MVGLSSCALGPPLPLEGTLQPHTGIDADAKASHTCPQSTPCPFGTGVPLTLTSPAPLYQPRAKGSPGVVTMRTSLIVNLRAVPFLNVNHCFNCIISQQQN